jgi:hypothetical protein
MDTVVSGASDDLIEIEGAICEEFTLHDDEKGDLLAFSTGVVLRIVYGPEGIWRITPLARADLVDVRFGTDVDSDYTDKARLLEEPEWVVHGTDWAKS